MDQEIITDSFNLDLSDLKRLFQTGNPLAGDGGECSPASDDLGRDEKINFLD